MLNGFKKALDQGWFNYKNFDIKEYKFRNSTKGGDINWIIPDVIAAFSSPNDLPSYKGKNNCEKVIKDLKDCSIKNVLRLNEPFYEGKKMEDQGISHYDLEYPDGSVPQQVVVEKAINVFKEVVRGKKENIAVHCRAGLGRTGTIIGIWMIDNYGFSAKDAIAWMRVCRPGMVMHNQARFLCRYERGELNSPAKPNGNYMTVERPKPKPLEYLQGHNNMNNKGYFINNNSRDNLYTSNSAINVDRNKKNYLDINYDTSRRQNNIDENIKNYESAGVLLNKYDFRVKSPNNQFIEETSNMNGFNASRKNEVGLRNIRNYNPELNNGSVEKEHQGLSSMRVHSPPTRDSYVGNNSNNLTRTPNGYNI